MSDYCLEIAEYMHKLYNDVDVDIWQFLLVSGPLDISKAIVGYYQEENKDFLSFIRNA